MKIFKPHFFLIRISPLLSLLTIGVGHAAPTDIIPLYVQHCASCHGEDRLGGTGPALLPENLSRLRRKLANAVIKQERPATQMPGFGDKLTDKQIQVLVDYIYTPLPEIPTMGMAEIKATHIIHHPHGSLPNTPIYDADPLNLFLVVELGDHHATVLDGDRLEPIHRFPTRFALHGGPKYSSDGRFVYLASRDGWISKFDMYNLKTVAEIRAGINTRNLAVSGDNRYVMVANYLPHTLVILNADDLSPIKVIDVRDDKGKTSRISAVYSAPPRHSFIAALKDIKEVWEIPYSSKATALPVYLGPMHDYREDSGEDSLVDQQNFPIRRIKLDGFLDDFFFDNHYLHLIGAARDGVKGQVVNLVVGRKIAEIDLPGMPHLGSGITWHYQGKPILATPNLKTGVVSVIDMRTWKTIQRIETLGPGFFMRSHENTPYAWVDVFFGPHKEAVHVIDKRTLKIVKTVRPSPGKTAAHLEFDRYGKYALLSVWDMDGALVIYDAATLEEIKRLPMHKPSGKYNVYNKISLSSGTSH
ncbi:cytochrome D1 domain-containing protein [Candidatus Parabeggiatoa sp. HSG14]|uniref:cytochrome D1 domain-containing protein n=1 Tax=Candidatus Parabeggiatoa sp. HSG14 TaxID=3055593 RepID=UPI0025A695FE|nr:cytochrome D1 domain-containing protein [Thiotrichales bacterium HSG14]